MSYLGTGPQVAFLKSGPALPDWSLPVPGLRTPMRLTCFPELRPTVQTPAPCTTTFSEPGENRSTIPNAPIGASRIAVSGASAYSHGAPAGVACLESTLPCREGQNPGR